MESAPTGLTRTLIATFLIAILAAGCIWVLSPFIAAIVWAAMIVVATWPLLLSVQRHVGNSRKLAVTCMVAAMALIVLLPLTLAVYALLSRADEAITWARNLESFTLPPAPEWLLKAPVLGSRISEKWNTIAAEGSGSLAKYLQPYARSAASWIVGAAQSTGLLFVHLILTIALVGIFYATGEKVARSLILFCRRIAGDRGESSVILAGQSIKAVALGIVVTALVQSILGGLGVWLAGIPFTGVLVALMFIFCIAQLGPTIPMLIGVAWMYTHDKSSAGTALLVWTLAVGLLDNFLRPLLIKRGADLPLLLILAGVIGGLLSFGVVGLFIGPVFLAVTYRLLQAWVLETETFETSAEIPSDKISPNTSTLSSAPMPQEFLDH
ncbi:AI-2E family transporter YdiK [Bdellovibrio svalbardensis]|uniref:AI-2E family transporter YdiK n=1 Tax=Bdellovibrio svalbardensis TaxID=2972972 RepID=A0ABT6DL56_9BACT|nr:AI-2E family transporter YdiK [Bdellovibrio svalbardensis]MDG0817386.1 AI-2E family transporter YdiK [Bdellovibrio svalbardensis]